MACTGWPMPGSNLTAFRCTSSEAALTCPFSLPGKRWPSGRMRVAADLDHFWDHLFAVCDRQNGMEKARLSAKSRCGNLTSVSTSVMWVAQEVESPGDAWTWRQMVSRGGAEVTEQSQHSPHWGYSVSPRLRVKNLHSGSYADRMLVAQSCHPPADLFDKQTGEISGRIRSRKPDCRVDFRHLGGWHFLSLLHRVPCHRFERTRSPPSDYMQSFTENSPAAGHPYNVLLPDGRRQRPERSR
jgi:hypothetical protein